jgi:hypothetical protein
MRHRFAASLCAAAVAVLATFAGTSLAGNGNGNGGSNGHAQGVKPSNTTQHDTYANASSNQTKQYGNGKTAGEIATQAGQPNATLHGPGNSQPHKTSCGGHEVDVHALKNHGGSCSAPTTSESGTGAVAQGYTTFFNTNVTLCHLTGASTYVTISPLASVVVAQYLGATGDIIPPFTYNGETYSLNWDTAHQAIYENGCTVPVTPSASAPATPPTTTTTTTTTAAVVPATPAPAAVAPQAQAVAQTGTSSASAATAAGGVKGATFTLTPKTTKSASAPLAKPKPAGGVLGATAHLGHTVTTGTLPFTGLRLWIIALIAAALVLIGALVRRTTSADDRI